MKYIREFENHAAYEAAESGLILPNVSLCVSENDVHYKPIVPISVTGVSLNKNVLELNTEATETLVATVVPNDAADKSVTWSSSDSNIATVTQGGVVSAVSSGNCVITVTTTDGGYTAQCSTTVVSPSHEYVDLGLPSGKKWAIGNLVKDSQDNYSIGEETDYGTYISWGNIVGHNEGEGYNFDQTTYNSTAGASVSADIPSNDSAHDICVSKLGSAWHLPTKEDFQELYDNTDTEWTTINGVAGRKFMKKTDHSIYVFFPASGHYNGTSLYYRGSHGFYWSSSWNSSTNAYNLYFSSSAVYPQSNSYRLLGFSVRAVLD